MTKTRFKAPVEHSILLVCFILVWLGPALKLMGLVDWSWWAAFAVIEGLWALAAVMFTARALVKLVVKLSKRRAD
jgi:hypothetical protein